MTKIITREIIDCYLNCKTKASLKLHGQTGQKTEYEIIASEDLMEVRNNIHAVISESSAEDVSYGEKISLNILRKSHSLYLDAIIENEELSIMYDGLLRTDGASRIGDYHYIPILAQNSERTERTVNKKFLGIISLLLKDIQGRAPTTAIIIYANNKIKRIKLPAKSLEASKALNEIKSLRQSETCLKPTLNTHCQICEFNQRCYDQAKASDDISLIRGIGEKEISKLARRGIFTVTQLSCLFRANKRSSGRSLKGGVNHYALKAKSIRDKKVYIIGSPKLSTSNTLIYFDVEGDPDQSYVYLIGAIIITENFEARHQFWANSRDEENDIFIKFADLVRSYNDVTLYSYGSYDIQFIKRMIKHSCCDDLTKLITEKTVNVLSIIREYIYFPTYSNGLKEIANCLGFEWSNQHASGLQSILWRRQWEKSRCDNTYNTLLIYNMDDCLALKVVVNFILEASQKVEANQSQNNNTSINNIAVSGVHYDQNELGRRDFGMPQFAIDSFKFINERSYFSYQHDKVFIRTSNYRKKRLGAYNRFSVKKKLRVDRVIKLREDICPFCGRGDLTYRQDGRLYRYTYNLIFTRNGIKRRVVKYLSDRHYCPFCKLWFLPKSYLRAVEYCHNLMSWAMYMHVSFRVSLNGVSDAIYQCFGMRIYPAHVWMWKPSMANFYKDTYNKLIRKLISGPLIHADETNVRLVKGAKGYVWVFTSMDAVVYIYKKSREGAFLNDFLKGFKGVLISDFYSAYDSIECPQQKCLIHLIRDINHDIVSNPWDTELKDIGANFGELMRNIMVTVDAYGLKIRHMRKHTKEVIKFYDTLTNNGIFQSELAEGYRLRFVKNKDKLFTFLNYNDIPWNNNNAEHAIKRFAKYRALIDGMVSENGLQQYLILLSIRITCEFNRIDFLKFMLSREIDIEGYLSNGEKHASNDIVEVFPDDVECGDRCRKKTWGLYKSGKSLVKNKNNLEVIKDNIE